MKYFKKGISEAIGKKPKHVRMQTNLKEGLILDLRNLILILCAVFEEMAAIEIRGCPSAQCFNISDDRCFPSGLKWKFVGSEVKKIL